MLANAISLDDYLLRFSHKEFDWRLCNCWHFAVGWVREVEGGDDPLAGFVMPRSASDCLRLLTANGPMQDQLSAVLHRPSMPINFARYGDLIMLSAGGIRSAIGICTGRLAAFVMEPCGLTFESTISGTRAWAVGGPE